MEVGESEHAKLDKIERANRVLEKLKSEEDHLNKVDPRNPANPYHAAIMFAREVLEAALGDELRATVTVIAQPGPYEVEFDLSEAGAKYGENYKSPEPQKGFDGYTVQYRSTPVAFEKRGN